MYQMTNTITDFEGTGVAGGDYLHAQVSGSVEDVMGYDVSEVGSDTYIVTGETVTILVGVDKSTLMAENFYFGPPPADEAILVGAPGTT